MILVTIFPIGSAPKLETAKKQTAEELAGGIK
jgi:hypothetical protein